MNQCLAKIPAAVLVATCCSLPLAIPRAAQAVPVRIDTDGLEGVDLVQRDSAGALRVFRAEDLDGDGMISFVAELDPRQSAHVHIFKGRDSSHSDRLPAWWLDSSLASASIPFLVTGSDERVIVQWNTLPTMPFTLGQPFSVDGGRISGLDAVVYHSTGMYYRPEIVDLDLTTLPLYAGPVQVGGLTRFQVVPEPSGLGLLAAAAGGLATLRFIRRRWARVPDRSPGQQAS